MSAILLELFFVLLHQMTVLLRSAQKAAY